MSLDPGNQLGKMIRHAIMERIGDPYYGAGISGGARKVGRPKKAAAKRKAPAKKKVGRPRKVGRPKGSGVSGGARKKRGAGVSGGRKMRAGVLSGDMADMHEYDQLGYSGAPFPTGQGISGGRTRRMFGGEGACYAMPYMGYPGNVGAGHSGGARKRKPAAKKRGGGNPWIKHLAMVRRQNPGLSVPEISRIASQSY